MGADGRETVTTAEAARLLNLSLRGVQSAVRRGRLQAEKCGGRWRVPVAEVERYRTFHLHAQADAAQPNRTPHRKAHVGGRRPKGAANRDGM